MLPNIQMSPFVRQCFVSIGVSLNMANMGSVMGFAAVLLPQLRAPDSAIVIDDASASLIAAFPAICVFVGNFMAPPIMSRFGRKLANIISLLVSVIGWVLIVFSFNVSTLLAARAIQGLGMGMVSTLGPVLIGEYTSPNNRGAFLMTISVFISAGVLIVQTLGSFMTWVTTAVICIGIVLGNLIIVLLSPESPTFLAEKGRYDACRKTFLDLRGDKENEELEKMIKACVEIRKENEKENTSLTIGENVKTKLDYFRATVTKREFYKPVIIMLHMYMVGQWCGVNTLTSYTTDLFSLVVGIDLNLHLMVITIQINRIISSCFGIFLVKTLKRRTMILTFVTLNLVVNLCVSGYTYSKAHNWMVYDHPAIGIILVHLQMFSIACGALPLGYVLAGEIFPMEFKSLCGGICTVFFSMNLFLNVWIVPLLFRTIGIYGSFLVHCVVMGYCLLFVGVTLPETKDRTLNDIEEEFKGTKNMSN